jgi:ferredoxin
MLVINPDECIDCALCEPECPAQAIVSEDELSEKEEIFKEINQKYSTKWPYISEHKPTTFDTGYWMSVEKTADMIKDKE